MAEQIAIDIIANNLASTAIDAVSASLGLMPPEVKAVTDALMMFGKAYIDLADSASKADQEFARMDVALRNAGTGVGVTTDQMEKFATAMSRSLGIDDATVVKSEALAITFGLQGNQINKAVIAAANLSAILGGDLNTNVSKIGRALETFDGYTSLTRQIGKLTDAQKEQIQKFKDANDLIGYQNYILGILNEKTSGQADAVDAYGTGWNHVNAEFDRMKETVGGVLLPALRLLNTLIADSLQGWNKFFDFIGIPAMNAKAMQGDTQIQGALSRLTGNTAPSALSFDQFSASNFATGSGSSSSSSSTSPLVTDQKKTLDTQLTTQKTAAVASEAVAKTHQSSLLNIQQSGQAAIENYTSTRIDIQNKTFNDFIVYEKENFQKELASWTENQDKGKKAQTTYYQSVADYTVNFYKTLTGEMAQFNKALGINIGAASYSTIAAGGTAVAFPAGTIGGQRIGTVAGHTNAPSVNVESLTVGGNYEPLLVKSLVEEGITSALNKAFSK